MTRASPRTVKPAAEHHAVHGGIIACCLLAALAAPAAAEKADRDKPVNLEADRVTIDDSKQIALFEGNVVLTQGTLQIRGDRMQVRQDKDGFRHGTTWGKPAHFRQKRDGTDEYIEGWAERIYIKKETRVIKLMSKVQGTYDPGKSPHGKA
ncbi:MAG: lipopolysaccharide transport periplasmic protein LptA, partial [Thermodesulfobacteriota bacterium]